MSIDTDYEVLRKVLAEHKPVGWAAEFGVYSGFSLNLIAEHMPIIGFDSFEGLPEDWREGFPAGMFDDAPGLCELMGPRRMIVPGWFENTIPTFPFPPLTLVHVDCDLYSSTVTVLEGIKNAIGVGTILVFDEFHGYPGAEEHEMKAWHEFCMKYRVTATSIATGEQETAFVITQPPSER